jgi:6-phosphogluconate dehydrogenase
MQIGIVGLGRMGGNMARRLARGGVGVTGFDPDAATRDALAREGAIGAVASLDALVAALPAPRVVWLMVPAGEPTTRALDELAGRLAPGDLVVDGGNANYKDSQRRAAELAARGLQFADCGVSGGVWGLDNGYALMFGGTREAAARLEPFARILAPTRSTR